MSVSVVTTAATLSTVAVAVSLAVSLVPSAAFVPVPLAVMVSDTVTSVSALTLGRVQVGVSAVALLRVPPADRPGIRYSVIGAAGEYG